MGSQFPKASVQAVFLPFQLALQIFLPAFRFLKPPGGSFFFFLQFFPPLFLLLQLPPQLFPPGKFFPVFFLCSFQPGHGFPPDFFRRLQLLPGLFRGRRFPVRLHLLQQGFFLGQHAAFQFSRLAAGLFRQPLRLFKGRSGLLHLDLRRGLQGFFRRGGVFSGAADRAGLSLCQGLRQDPRLLVQKRPVSAAVYLPCLFRALRRPAVGGTSGFQFLPGNPVLIQSVPETSKFSQLPLQPGSLPGKFFFFSGRVFQRLELLPQSFCLCCQLLPLPVQLQAVPAELLRLPARLFQSVFQSISLPDLFRKIPQLPFPVFRLLPFQFQLSGPFPGLLQGGLLFLPLLQLPDLFLQLPLRLPLLTGGLLCFLLLLPAYLSLLLQFLIPGKLSPQNSSLSGQLFPQRLFLLFFLHHLLSQSQLLTNRFSGFLSLLKADLRFFPLFRLGQKGMDLLHFPIQLPGFRLQGFPAFFVLLQKLRKKFLYLRGRQFPGSGLLRPGSQGTVLRTLDPLDILGHAASGSVALRPQLPGFPFQLFLEHLIGAGVKNVPEDPLALPGVRQQQLQKISLRDHGDLGKLLIIQADDLLHRLVHLPDPGHQTPIRQRQFRLRPLKGLAAAPPGGTEILRIPPYLIHLAAVGKDQFHLCGSLRPGVFGAEHARLPAGAAGLPVEGKGDGIKKSGLSGSCVPADQIQARGAQLFHLQFGPPGIGAESGKGQFQRSHSLSSHMVSISSLEKRICSSVIG